MAKIVQTEGRTSSLLECYAEVQPIFCKDTKKNRKTIPFNSIFYFPPKDCPSGSHQTIFPQKPQNTETIDGEYPPTDCTDFHRLGGYGILPYPRSHQTIFPQKPTQPNHLCASVKSVGGSSPPEASVYSVKSVGEYPPPETSVNSVNSVGGLAQTNLEWVLWKEFGGRRGYGRDAIPSYENSHGLHGCAQIRRVWHPCHTHAATKLSSHGIHGTQKRQVGNILPQIAQINTD